MVLRGCADSKRYESYINIVKYSTITGNISTGKHCREYPVPIAWRSTDLVNKMMYVVLDLRHPLPHDGENVSWGGGEATEEGRTPATPGVEEGEVPAGTLAAERGVHRRVGDRGAPRLTPASHTSSFGQIH